MKKYFLLCLMLFNSVLFAKENKISWFRIVYYPSGIGKNAGIVIYDNSDSIFSNGILRKLKKAKRYIFYNPSKQYLSSGYYKFWITEGDKNFEFEVRERGVVFDCKRESYLRYDIVSDFYEYLALHYLKTLCNSNQLREN